MTRPLTPPPRCPTHPIGNPTAPNIVRCSPKSVGACQNRPLQENLCSTGFSKALEEEGPCVVRLQSPAQLLFPATLCHLLSLNLIHVLNSDQSSPRDAGETRELAYVGDNAECGSCCSARVGVVGKGVWGTCGQKRQGHRGHCGGGCLESVPPCGGGPEEIFAVFPASLCTLASGSSEGLWEPVMSLPK